MALSPLSFDFGTGNTLSLNSLQISAQLFVHCSPISAIYLSELGSLDLTISAQIPLNKFSQLSGSDFTTILSDSAQLSILAEFSQTSH